VETANNALGSNLQVTVTNKQTSSSRHRSPPPSTRSSGNGPRFGNSPRTPPPSHYTSSSGGGGGSGSVARDSRSSRYVGSPHKEEVNAHHRSSHDHGYQGRYSGAGSSSHDARKVKRLSPGRFGLNFGTFCLPNWGKCYRAGPLQSSAEYTAPQATEVQRRQGCRTREL